MLDITIPVVVFSAVGILFWFLKRKPKPKYFIKFDKEEGSWFVYQDENGTVRLVSICTSKKSAESKKDYLESK